MSPLFANIENSSDPLEKKGRVHYANFEYPTRKAKKTMFEDSQWNVLLLYYFWQVWQVICNFMAIGL